MSSDERGPSQPELAGQQAMFKADGPGDNAKKKRRREPVHFKGTRSLEGLRIRIDLIVKELNRLREENHHLHKELDAMKLRGHDETGGTSVVFSESAPALHARLESYVAIVDRFIAREEASVESPTE